MQKGENTMKYKGYYIEKDSVNGFHSKEDIDNFLRNQAVKDFKMSVEMFAAHSTMECSIFSAEKADRLVKGFGFTWEQVEALEIETLEALA